MRWTAGGPSQDVEDRRSQSGGFGGGGMRRVGGLGIGGFLLLLVLSLVTGKDFLSLLGTSVDDPSAPSDTSAPPARSSPEEEQLVQFVSFVLDDVQKTWSEQLQGRYERTRMVLFRDVTQSGCGVAEAATGPFYCPADHKVYLDLGFFQELKQRFGAPGDFAQAYVIAHEIGHHLQTLLGIESQVRELQRARPAQANQLSVRLELQADCLAGVWGRSTSQRDILERGDVEEGLGAAAAVGDDRLQRMAGARVAPEKFTHGSSAQRLEWFKRGFDSGRLNGCEAFQ